LLGSRTVNMELSAGTASPSAAVDVNRHLEVIAAATAAFSSAFASAPLVSTEEDDEAFCFKLANGYVQRAQPPASTKTEAAAASASNGSDEKSTGKRSKAFWFHNRQMTEKILLYGNQVACLIDALPKAFEAHQRADHSFRYKVAQTKNQLLMLEVVCLNERSFVFLKKYFKPNVLDYDDSGQPFLRVDQDSKWLPTRAAISFDPHKDKPRALLEFVLARPPRSSH